MNLIKLDKNQKGRVKNKKKQNSWKMVTTQRIESAFLVDRSNFSVPNQKTT